MASLTAARSRTRASSPSRGQTRNDEQVAEYEDDRGLDKSASFGQGAYPPTTGTTNYSQRPFGSNVPVSNGNHAAAASTTGWVSSGDYKDKGKGKLGSSNKAGNGPLRDYGGGLGVVGSGEFKLLLGVTILAAVVRLWRLDRPTSVVFDEVHFGGFATKYLKNRFFMDVHPPLAKLLITFAAWFAGFRGNFDFKDIGKEYGPDHVPYIAMRLLPASLGVALVPIAYLTLRSLGCRPATALLASLLLTFENGLITQSRLILLDSPLLFFTGLTTFFWVGFTAEDGRRAGSSCGGPFCRTWWAWLALTGVSLGATLSCKWVGLFTVATVGLATIEQLWQILGDTRVSMKTLGRHFVARAICLIVIPSFVYMFWFWIHFMVLNHSGDGDGFMSSEFQHTLGGHGMEDTFADVMLGSRITLRHLHTQGGYLHSHAHNYPGGSKQQQITLYPHKDDNNDWILVNETQQIGKETDPSLHGDLSYVMDKSFIRLHHASSGKKLHSHDIRPSVSEVDFQNEVSAYGFPDFDGDANDNFQIEIDTEETDSRDRHAKKRVRTLRTKFRLRHVLTGCYLFSHKVKLPEWGFDQQEVTCNKNPTKDNAIWFIETNTHPLMDAKAEKVNYRRPSFISKFLELQAVMWRTNAGLTDRHAYDSRPHHWPYLRRGINFWVKDHRQIYLIGNPVIWWISSFSVFLYAAARGFLILRAKRGYKDLNNTTVSFYDRLCGFLFIGWALHYFPFFIMQRQLFLHHYFPALYYSLLLFASVFDLATSALKPKFRVQMAAIVLICALWAYIHFSPLVYAGKWTKQDCEDSKWLKNWDFSCGDFHQDYPDYDNVPHPTANKPLVQVGTGNGPAVEAETPSNAETVVEPAKNAFAPDKDEPAPAPRSSAAGGELFRQAEAAHSSAEQKEDAEHTALSQVRETEPTNLPGAELPAALVESQVKKEVQEEINREAPVPLAEAAPTPSDETTEAVPIASQSNVEEKEGAQLVRLAQADINAKGVEAKLLKPLRKDSNEEEPDAPVDAAAQAADEEQLGRKLFQGEAQAPMKAKVNDGAQLPDPVKAAAHAAAGAPRKARVKMGSDEGADAAVDPVEPIAQARLKKVPLDADEQAALEERERFQKEQEQEALAKIGGNRRLL